MSKLTKMLTMTAAAAMLFTTATTSFAANAGDVVGFPVEQQEMHAFSVEFEAPGGGIGFEFGDDHDWDDDYDYDYGNDWDDDDGWDDDDYSDWDDDDDDYDPWG